jgi:hypothetical protein
MRARTRKAVLTRRERIAHTPGPSRARVALGRGTTAARAEAAPGRGRATQGRVSRGRQAERHSREPRVRRARGDTVRARVAPGLRAHRRGHAGGRGCASAAEAALGTGGRARRAGQGAAPGTEPHRAGGAEPPWRGRGRRGRAVRARSRAPRAGKGCAGTPGEAGVCQLAALGTSSAAYDFTGLSGEPTVDPANGRPRNPRTTRGRANGQKGAPDCPVCTGQCPVCTGQCPVRQRL